MSDLQWPYAPLRLSAHAHAAPCYGHVRRPFRCIVTASMLISPFLAYWNNKGYAWYSLRSHTTEQDRGSTFTCYSLTLKSRFLIGSFKAACRFPVSLNPCHIPLYLTGWGCRRSTSRSFSSLRFLKHSRTNTSIMPKNAPSLFKFLWNQPTTTPRVRAYYSFSTST
jgi:hypothetical protein